MLHDDDDDNRREPWTNQEVVSIIILSIFVLVNFLQLVFQISSKEFPILKLVTLVNLEHPKCDCATCTPNKLESIVATCGVLFDMARSR